MDFENVIKAFKSGDFSRSRKNGFYLCLVGAVSFFVLGLFKSIIASSGSYSLYSLFNFLQNAIPLGLLVAGSIVFIRNKDDKVEPKHEAAYTEEDLSEENGDSMIKIRNRVLRISLPGGLIGALTVNPKAILDKNLIAANKQGWVATQVQPHKTTNLLILMLQILVLVLTMGLYTWGSGYLVLLEKSFD